MNSELYYITPSAPIPGCLVTIVPASQKEKLIEIETEKLRKTYIVRAVISENIPLADEIPTLISKSSKSLITINGNPLTMYLHHSGLNAIFYDLVPRENGELSHVDVQVEADHPDATLAPARTAINQLLDTLMREIWLPLTIVRLDVFEENGDKPLIHQLHFPFLTKLNFGPIGGYDSFPALAAYEALAREAIVATSPYYRFLCAYRLCEGINHFRHLIRQYAERLNVNTPMPRPPVVSSELIESFGFSQDFANKINKFDDLVKELKKFRNAIAHFLWEEYGKKPLHISDGYTYRLYAAASALLLHYSHESFNDLRIFFNQNISSHLFRGSILPEMEKRQDFVIKAPSIWAENNNPQ